MDNHIQSTSRDLEVAPKPTGSGGSVGGGSRGSNSDLGSYSNGSTGGADSPTQAGGAAAASTPTAHPSRDILDEVLSRPGPYPMVSTKNPWQHKIKRKTNYLFKRNLLVRTYINICKKNTRGLSERKPST